MNFDDLEDEIQEQRERNAAFLSAMAARMEDPEMRELFASFAARQSHPYGWGTAYDTYGLYLIKDPDHANSRIGNCSMKGQLKEGDIALCIGHSGDYFHTFVLLDVKDDHVAVRPETKFGAYAGIGEKAVQLSQKQYLILTEFGPVEQSQILGIDPPRP